MTDQGVRHGVPHTCRGVTPRIASIALPALAMAAIAPGAVGAQSPGRVILDESTYWRSAYRLGRERVDPGLLKTEAGKWIPDVDLKRIKARVVRDLRREGLQDADWREHVYVMAGRFYNGQSLSGVIGWLWEAEPLPEDWMSPEFDALDWPRRRRPFLMGTPPPNPFDPFGGKYDRPRHWLGGVRHLEIALAAHRAWFEVADPSLVGELRLTVRYRGGVRVLLNGKEMARGHLPKGALDLKTVAEGYPAEAYLILPGEDPDGLVRRGDEPAFWPDLYGPFPEGLKPEKVRRYYPFPQPHEKGIWDRVQGLRHRRLSLALPRQHLRKGSNLLAIEVRRSDLHPVVLAGKSHPWARDARQDVAWPHCTLPQVELRATGAGVVPARARGHGARLRASDIHTRLYDRDYVGPGVPARPAFAMGARNGTAAAALVLETDRALARPEASVGAFRRTGSGDALPVSVARLHWMKPRLISEIRGQSGRAFSYASNVPHGYAAGDKKPLMAYDQLGSDAPRQVAADAIQPLWLSVRVPKDARPGLYEGKVSVRAGGASLSLSVVLEVCPWTVPDPSDFATFVAAEQSPYGVAGHYRAPLWSQPHFRLMAGSFAELARLGSRWLNVPAVCNTEFGNRGDTLIRWIQKRDGTLRFDCTILDRYLDLALEHLKRIDVVNVVVISDGTVRIADGAGGKTKEVRLLTEEGLVPERRADWRAFAKAVHAHFKKRGLQRSLYWGMTWDNVKQPRGLKEVFAEAAPNVFWTRAGHNLHFDAFYKAAFGVYGIRWNWQFDGRGWKSKELALLNSRNSISPARDMSPYMAYRTFPDNALSSGHRGIGRMGADYWGVHMQGWKGGNRSRFPGFLTNALLWPGPRGAEPSPRLEILIEGLQETEARIFIERALDESRLPERMAREASEALARYSRSKRFSVGDHENQPDFTDGWRERTRQLYATAGRVAAALAR